MDTTGIKALEITGAASAVGPLNGTNDVIFSWGTMTETTVSNAEFLVVLDVYLGQ